MKTQTLEQELEGFRRIGFFGDCEILEKGKKGILYNADKKEIIWRYRMVGDIVRKRRQNETKYN